METKHTPGPWRVIVDDCGPLAGRPSVVASEELDCGIVHWDGFVQEYWRSARGDKEIEANARLIASAPDLLEIVQFMANFDGRNNNKHLKDLAKTAYTKATGEVL